MNIVYTGLFAYPDSSANSLRVQGIVQILEDLGHDVTICPGLLSSVKNVSMKQPIAEVNEYASGVFSKVSGLRGMFVGNNTIDWLESLQEKPDIIILYGTHLGYLLRLLKFTKKYKIKLILDVVEWYDPRHLPGGIFGPFSIMNELSMRFFVKKADGIITISHYLKEYYHNKGCSTVLIPPVFQEDSSSRRLDRTNEQILNLCYVGTPGKKEDFNILFKTLDMFYNIKKKFKVHLVGMKKEDFILKYKNIKFIHDVEYCHFYGKVINDKAKKIIASCDFTMVFRPNQRFANAGFPSKIPESLSLGTPIFCNTFSDIERYLDKKNNLLIETPINEDKIFESLSELFMAENKEFIEKRLSAFNCFQENFSLKANSQKMKFFLEEFDNNLISSGEFL